MILKRLVFTPRGQLSEVPDSQTIFGAFCYLYRDVYGTKKLEQLLLSITERKQKMLISSMFLHDTLPIPLSLEPQFVALDSLKDDEFQLLKKGKKARFFSRTLFNDFQKNQGDFNRDYYQHIFSKNYRYLPDHHLIVTESEVDTFDSYKVVESLMTRNKVGNEDEKQLFYNHKLHYSSQTMFDVYLDIDMDIYQEFILALQKYPYLSIGGKKSIGMNLYAFVKMEEVEIMENDKHKILLSKAIYNQEAIDFSQSFYRLKVDNPHHGNHMKQARFKQGLTLIEEGSALKIEAHTFGKILFEEVEGKTIYHHLQGLIV